MKSLFSSLYFDATNFLSCMTLDVEQLHSSSHIKHPLLSKKEYCRDLWNTKKESTKLKLSEKAVEEMRNYASTYGAAVSQTTNRQETTMARHRTMPEMFSQRKLHISEDRVDLALFEGSVSSVVNENEEEVETAESDLENGEEVQSTTQVQTKTRNQKMEIHAFLNLTDGPLSY